MFRRITQKYLNLYLSLFVTLIISLISYLGFFDHINGFIYDKTVSLTPNKKLQERPVLLVEISSGDLLSSEREWEESLGKILSLDPKSFLFLTNPKNPEVLYNKFSPQVPIFFSQELEYLYEKQKVYKKATTEKLNLSEKSYGYIAVPESKDGIFRTYQDSFDTDFGTALSLEKRVANSFSPKKDLVGKYYINFNNSNSLPVISLERLLKEGLVPEIIQNKHIIFGYKKRDLEIGLSTPLLEKNLTHLEFFGYSFLTILQESYVTYIYGIYEVLVVLFFLFTGLFVHSFFRISFTPYSVVFAIPFIYALTFSLLHFFYIWLPITEILVVTTFVSYLIIWRRSQERKINANRLMSTSADKIRERVMHKTFFNSDEYWDYIARLITQTLNLNRIIFLEKTKGDHRLSEIKAVHCNFEDILEMRRDYEREPYKSAIEAREAIEAKERQFFKDLKDEESQYIVPLIYSGQVMGFWAFTVNRDLVENIANFKDILSQYSNEISTLLYQRSEWRVVATKEKKPWEKLIVATDSDDTFRKIQGTFTILDKRLNLLETVINRYDNGMILYDMFGRVYHINKRMQGLLSHIGVLPFKISGEELVATLCSLENSVSTTVFRDAILEKESFLFEVKTDIERGHSYLLKGAPISKEDLGGNFNDTFLFDNYGILIEIIDISTYKDQVDLKRDVIKESNRQIREILQPIVTAFSLKEMNPENKEVVRHKFNSFIFAYNKMEDLISQDIFFGQEQYYPVEITPYLTRSIKSLTTQAQEALIEFDIQHQTRVGLAFVNPVNIQELLTWFLKFLIEDGAEESKISIDIQENQKEIVLILGNEGFGIPNEKFQKLLFGKEPSEEFIYTKVKESISKIEKVGGRVVGFSQHGEGIIFMIYLKRYQ